MPALCLGGFAGWLLSSPPNGWPVLLLDVLGRGGRLGSVRVVPVAFGGMARFGGALPPHGGACFGGGWPSSWWGMSPGVEKF